VLRIALSLVISAFSPEIGLIRYVEFCVASTGARTRELVLGMFSRLDRLFWKALDRVDYAVMLARCWVVDLIYGPESPTLADEKRGADHERLHKAFPGIDLDETIAIADEERHEQTPTATLTTPVEASLPPRSPAAPTEP
jgi:hypothetical protein